MTVTVHTVTSGSWRQNGYVLEHENGHALVIDPGDEADRYRALIDGRGLKPAAILNTHAHYDHIGAVCALMRTYPVEFYLHGGDAALLRQTNLYLRLFETTKRVEVPPAYRDLEAFDGRLETQGFSVQVLSTKGHTRGSVCFLVEGNLFSGDTLLPNGHGRTDLPGGSDEEMTRSLARLRMLPGALTVYPGHGKPLSLAQALEKAQERSPVA